MSEDRELLEALSDKVRKGEPVGFFEAIAVIDYQEGLRRERDANSWRARLKRRFRAWRERTGFFMDGRDGGM